MKAMTVLRERSMLEIHDLALTVFRRFFIPIMLFSAVGILPFVLGYLLLLGLISGIAYEPNAGTVASVVFLFLAATIICYPLSQFGVSWYLGQRQFFIQPTFKGFRQALKATFGSFFVMGFVIRILTLVIFMQPYYPEVTILERQSIGKCWKRLSILGRYDRTPSFVSNMTACLTVMILVILGTLAGLKLTHIVRFQQADGLVDDITSFMIQLVWPILMLWFTYAYLNVARFFSYLDARTRIEGWHIDHAFDNIAEELGYERQD